MSALSEVRNALKENSAFVVLEVIEHNSLPQRGSSAFEHTLDFFVAPKAGGIYVVREMQEAMLSLIPIPATMKDDFRSAGSYVEFGKLYFDEEIGKIRTVHEIDITDEELKTSCGLMEGKRKTVDEQPLRRRIWVRLYPNIDLAKNAISGMNLHRISDQDLVASMHRRIAQKVGA